MSLLYDEVKRKTEVYSFQFNSGGVSSVKESGVVAIWFNDGKFSHVVFPLNGNLTRNGWKIAAAVDHKIKEIEDRKNG